MTTNFKTIHEAGVPNSESQKNFNQNGRKGKEK